MSERPSPQPRPLSRRAFLQRALATGALTAGGASLAGCSVLPNGGSSAGAGAQGSPGLAVTGAAAGAGGVTGAKVAGRLVAGASDDRVLVMVDLQGGNDGLSTLVPYGSGRYYDLRPELAVPQEEVLVLDDDVGLHPSLARLHSRGLLTVEGVGPIDGDLSHFDMAARWQRGDVDGSNPGSRTGFLARLVDTLDDGSPLVGVSTAGSSPYLMRATASTISLSDPGQLWMLEPTDWDEMDLFQRQLAKFDDGTVSAGYRRLLDLASDLDTGEDEIDWDLPMLAEGGDLGRQLHLASELVTADVGTRVIYAAAGDYDTHSGHMYRQADNLSQLDAAVDGFLERAETLGLGGRVVVATVSEFGRRVPENDSGLDHGSASTMLVAGAGLSGRHGERPDIADLDEDDNLRTAVGFDRYLASLAEEWLGVEAASVLSCSASAGSASAASAQPLGLF